jgi:hypothetical protein
LNLRVIPAVAKGGRLRGEAEHCVSKDEPEALRNSSARILEVGKAAVKNGEMKRRLNS